MGRSMGQGTCIWGVCVGKGLYIISMYVSVHVGEYGYIHMVMDMCFV